MGVSIAHHHLLSIIASELPADQREVVILDAGCGGGELLALLFDQLTRHRPQLAITLHGFDVSDSGVQEPGYFRQALALLYERVPGVNWNERLRLIRSTDPWPYDDGAFDFVVSNHVLEHVTEPELFVNEVARVLKPGGKSAHLFPVRNSLFEVHLRLPLAHWVRDHDALRGYIRLASYFGWGRYREHRRAFPGLTRAEYAERQADFLTHFTRYWSRADIHRLAQRSKLRCSWRYTEHFYSNRLRLLLGMAPKLVQRPSRPRMLHPLLVFVLMWFSSLTVFLEKKQTYQAVDEARS